MAPTKTNFTNVVFRDYNPQFELQKGLGTVIYVNFGTLVMQGITVQNFTGNLVQSGQQSLTQLSDITIEDFTAFVFFTFVGSDNPVSIHITNIYMNNARIYQTGFYFELLIPMITNVTMNNISYIPYSTVDYYYLNG